MSKKKYPLLLVLLNTIFLTAAPFSSNQVTSSSDSKSAECVMELNSRRVLYEAYSDIRLPMASTTKIATAATVLSLCNDISKEIEIPAIAEGVEGSSVYLKQGDIYSVEDLLYGLMLRSGNDCATALAVNCSGNIPAFCLEMNKTGQKAGAFHTVFKNPHGLPCEGHYTTAKDLSLLTCYAMQNPIFCKIVATKYYEPRNWKNKNKMLYNYEGAIGVKTGYTKEAGRCLVSAATRNNFTLVCTVLNCSDMYERSSQLLNDAFDSYEYTQLLAKGQRFCIKTERGDVLAKAENDFYYPLLKEEKEYIEMKTYAYPKRSAQKIVGKIEIYLSKRLLFSANLYKL